MHINRKLKKNIQIGNVQIGGDNPILIQSMTTTNTKNVDKTVAQINELEQEGCEIIRVAVPDMASAEAIKQIKEKINIPLVGDIHFDYRLAIKSIENGIDKIRINPGNIGAESRIRAVIETAMKYNVPIRIGVNSGSLEKEFIEKYKKVTAEGMVESTLKSIKTITEYGYDNLVLALKSSSVLLSIEAYKLISEQTNYPLHVGITESGTLQSGSIKSSVGIGSLLAMGIGDTIRVSLTENPIEEVRCAKEILKSLELRKFGVDLISCPTCGRTAIDIISLTNDVEKLLKNVKKDIKVAVMGCAVNGPGEAREADIGIAGGDGYGLIFKKGEILCKVEEKDLLNRLMEEIEKL